MDAPGIRLVIHQRGTLPFPEEEGITLNPNYETSIGMRMACLKLCRQTEILKRCNCRPSTTSLDLGIADMKKYKSCLDKDYTITCEDFVINSIEQNRISCNCRSPCNQNGYQLISDVGGALGLFMGASILSFVEVLQFIIELINFLRHKIAARRSRKTVVTSFKAVSDMKDKPVETPHSVKKIEATLPITPVDSEAREQNDGVDCSFNDTSQYFPSRIRNSYVLETFRLKKGDALKTHEYLCKWAGLSPEKVHMINFTKAMKNVVRKADELKDRDVAQLNSFLKEFFKFPLVAETKGQEDGLKTHDCLCKWEGIAPEKVHVQNFIEDVNNIVRKADALKRTDIALYKSFMKEFFKFPLLETLESDRVPRKGRKSKCKKMKEEHLEKKPEDSPNKSDGDTDKRTRERSENETTHEENGPSENDERKGKKRTRQNTNDDSAGVVVVEDIKRAKAILKEPNTTVEQMIECLSGLEKKIPSRKVLLETKIGNVINKLRKHENDEIRKHARQVYVKWKTHFVEHRDRPQIEVQFDLKTEKTRKAGRKFISEALELQSEKGLPEIIEREVFHVNNRFLSSRYKRTMRNIWFKLKNDQTVKAQVLDSSLSVQELVKQCSPTGGLS
uniref:Uncharacterized protein C1orf83 n=1 Tax=Magallana gigas TaxID=29159 RepID=K1QGN9_MAGGI